MQITEIKQQVKKMSKISKLLMVSCLVIGCLSGCGKKEVTPEARVELTKLQEDMLSTKDELPEMSTVSANDKKGEELFASLSDVEYDKIQDYFFAYAKDGMASEVAVVFVKYKNDVAEVEKSLKEHRESRVLSYENYAPDQVETAKSAVIFSKGNYVAYIMNKEFSHIKATFESAME